MEWTDQAAPFPHLRRILFGVLLACACLPLSAQGIFSCTDAKGRRITSDRPIPECIDRDQTELSSQGTVKRVIKPSMTVEEREAYDSKLQKEQAALALANEERRKNRALVIRFPDKTAHDKVRKEALLSIEVQAVSANARLAALEIDRKKYDDEMEFYKKDPAKAPFALRRKVQDTQQGIEEQKRLLESQTIETQNIHKRFDQELAKLRILWAENGRAETGLPLKTQAR